VTFDLLADDVAALIDALGLERPLITGFSDGGSPRRCSASAVPTPCGRS
jgi:pimeloyl-ACP methyl ester carboxylesterase